MLWPSVEEMEHQLVKSFTAIGTAAQITPHECSGSNNRNQVALRTTQLKEIASGLTTNFTKSGSIELYFKGENKQVVTSSMLQRVTKEFGFDTQTQVVRACLEEHPSGFLRTWGEYKTSPKKTHV